MGIKESGRHNWPLGMRSCSGGGCEISSRVYRKWTGIFSACVTPSNSKASSTWTVKLEHPKDGCRWEVKQQCRRQTIILDRMFLLFSIVRLAEEGRSGKNAFLKT